MANLMGLAAAKIMTDYNRRKSVQEAAADVLAASAAQRAAGTYSAGGGGGSPVDTWQDRLLGNTANTPAASGSIWSRDPSEAPEPSEALKSSTADRAVILEAALNRLRGRTQATQATQAGAPVEEPEDDGRFTTGQRRSAEAKARWEVMDKWQSADGSNLSPADQVRFNADMNQIPTRTQEILDEMERRGQDAQQPAAKAEPAEPRSIWARNAENVPASQIRSGSRQTVAEAAMDKLKGGSMDLSGKDPYTTAERRSAEQQARWEVQDKWQSADGSNLSPADQVRFNADMDKIPQRAQEILKENTRKAQQAEANQNASGDLAQRQRRYADLMEANRTGSTDGLTPEQRQEAEAAVDSQLNWSDLVASYNGNEDLALDYYGRELDRNLRRIAARDREKEIETLKASDPQAAEVYDFMHRPERLSAVFNPFDSRQELEDDLASAQGYQPSGVGDREVNGSLAQRTADGIRARMAYQDDPEKAMADVQADLERLRKIKQDGSYNPDQVQQLIWQQERQLKLLEGYAAAKKDADGSLAAKGREEYLAGLSAEQKAYADRAGITGGTSVAQMGAKAQTANLIYNTLSDMAGLRKKGGAELSNLAMMTEEERNGYFALYAQDKAAAKTYLEGMQSVLASRSMDIQESARGVIAEAAPVAWSAAEELEGLATEPIKPIASAIVAGQHLTGNEIQRGGWAEYVATQGDKNAERLKGTIASAMEAKGYSEEQIALAQAAYGILHNTAANLTRGAASTAMGIPSALSTALMAFGTLGSTYYNLTDSTVGTGQNQRMITAAGDAVSEFVTEALSDAHMFEAFKTGFRAGDSWWQTASNAAWQIIAGGTIESGTEVLNDIASQEWHNLMLGQESEANRRLDYYYRSALAGQYANNPTAAMEWAQQQAFKDTMSGFLETAWTSFASGGLMDIGGRAANWVRQAPIRQQDRALKNYQFQEGSRATAPSGNSVEAGTFGSVADAEAAIRAGYAGTGSVADGSYDSVDAAVEAIQGGYADSVSLTYNTQQEAEQAAYTPRESAREERRPEPAPANDSREQERPADQARPFWEDILELDDEAEVITHPEGWKIGDREPAPKPASDTRTQERPEEQPQEQPMDQEQPQPIIEQAAEPDTARVGQPADGTGTRGMAAEQAAQERQPVPDQPEQRTPDQPEPSRPVERPAEQEQRPPVMQLGDPADEDTRDVGGYRPEWVPEAATDTKGAPAAAQAESAGTTAAERISRSPIQRDEERITVAPGTRNAEAVGDAAEVITREEDQDGVARVIASLPADKAPKGDAEGRADVQVMGDAYAAAMRGQDLADLGGIYTLTPERKALVKAAHEQGQTDLAAKTAEIARKNAAIAESTGFRDGAKYVRHMNGVNLQGVTNDLTAGQKLQLGVLDAMGRKFGIDFRIYDSLGNKNAMYRRDSGQVDISLAADGGLVKAASHELYHYISAWNKDAAAQVKNLVLDYLRRAPGYDLDTRVQEVTGAYINAGELDFDALEEIVADSMMDMLADDAAKLSGAIYADMDNAQSIAGKAAEHIKRVSDFLRDQLARITGKSPEIRALHDQSDYVAAVGDILRKSVMDATRNRQAKTYNNDLINADPRGIVGQYYNNLEEQYTNGQARTNMNQRILRLMLDADGNPLHLSAAEGLERLGQAFTDYTSGNKSMAKALEDQGMKAPDEDLIRVAVFAAREAQAQTEAQGFQSGAYTPSITYDDDFDSMARAGQTYGGVDEDHEAHLILQKIFDILKRGRTWQTDQESLQPGQWAADLDGIVDDIKRTTGTRTAADRIKTELRAMYTALDEALLRGEDFGIGQAVTYARRIAEMIAEKSGQRIELEDDALTDMMRSLRGKTITLSQAQADEARARYGNIRALNNAYRGLVSFTIKKTTAGSLTLEDLQAEHEMFFSRDLAEGDIFTRFEDLATEYRGQREGMVDYNGLTRSEFERDLALRIVGGYFDLSGGTVSQTAGKTQAKTKGEEKYVAAIRQLRTEYNRRTRELESEYQRKAEQLAEMSEDEIEAAKQDYQAAKHKIISSYEYQVEQTAAAIGTPLSAETKARLMAGMDLEEASLAYFEMRRRIEAEIERRAAERAERLAKAITRNEINGRAQEVVDRRIKRWQDAEARNALRKGIEKTVNDFAAKLMHPTDKRHAPEEMRTAFAQVLNLVNTSNPRNPTGFRTRRWHGVQNWLAVSGLLEQYSDDTSVMFDENLTANLTWLQTHAAGKSIMQMNVEELRTLSETLTAIKHTFDHYDEMLTVGQEVLISEIAEPLNEMAIEQHRHGRAHPRLSGLRQTIAQQVQGSWMDPIRWRNWADRRTGSTGFGSRVHGMLRDAQDKQIRNVKDAEERFGQWLQGVDRKAMEEMHGKKAGTISVMHGDQEIRMTRGQAMSLYLLMQREQAVGHILGGDILDEAGTVIGHFPGGGITIGRADSKDGEIGTYKPIEVNQYEIDAILDQLTPAEKRLADGTRAILDWCSQLGNEVSMLMYGYRKYTESNYFPIKTDPHYNSQTLTADNSNPLYRLKNMGFTKVLQVNANSPLLIQDMFDVVRDHAVGMINYNAWVIPAMDITRVLNYKLKDSYMLEGMTAVAAARKTVSTTSQALEILMGENGQRYLDQLLKDINGIKGDDNEKKGNIANSLLSKFKGGAVAYNLSTAMKQPWSVTRAWATIGINYFTPGRQRGCSGDVTDLMEQYAPIYVWKQYGNFILELGKSMDQIMYPQMEQTVKGWINDKSMAFPGWMDNQTWKAIWRAAEKKTAHDQPGLTPGSEEFYRAVAREFRECIDQTQVVDGIMQRTQYMRSKGGYAKMTTSFMGEPMKSFNLFADAVAGVVQTEKGTTAHRDAGRALARAAVVYATSSMTMAVVSSFVSAFRHWDGDEPWMQTFMRYLTGFGNWNEFKETKGKDKLKAILGSNLVGEFSILNKLPILRDAFTIATGWDVERTDMSAIKDLWDSGMRLWQALSGGGKTSLPKAARDFAGYVSTLFGMPMGNLAKEIGYLSNGCALGAQQIIGQDTFAWQYFNMRMNLNIDFINNSTSYIKLMKRASDFGNEDVAAQIRHDLIEAGVKEKNIDAKLRKLYKADAGGEVEEYAALLEAGKKDEAAKMRAAFGGGTAAFDDAVEDMIGKDRDVAEANYARKSGDLEPMKKVIERYRKLGYEDSTIWSAINAQYNSTEAEEDRVSVTSGSMWLANDLNEAVFRGDMEDIKYIVKWMTTENGKKTSTIKSGVTKEVKQEYTRMVKAGDTMGAERLMKTLLDMGLGYTEKEIKGWLSGK